MGLFKSKFQRETERRLKIRQSKRRLEKQIGRLAKERERYFEMGREAAKNGNDKKVETLARAIVRFRQMEGRFEDLLLHLDLVSAQREVATIQADFVQALKACARSVRDAQVLGNMEGLAEESERASLLVEEATEQLDLFVEEGDGAGIPISRSEWRSEADALKRDMMDAAKADEEEEIPAKLEADLTAIREELKRDL